MRPCEQPVRQVASIWYCSSAPAPTQLQPITSNVRTIPHLRELFKCEVGLSDHTMGVGAAVAAVALGASVIESTSRSRARDGGVDSSFSMEPQELQMLTLETQRAWRALGQVSYGASTAEQGSLIFRRSLYVVQDIAEGEALTLNNLRPIRPGYGCHPNFSSSCWVCD